MANQNYQTEDKLRFGKNQVGQVMLLILHGA
jgi:hypothetical protein